MYSRDSAALFLIACAPNIPFTFISFTVFFIPLSSSPNAFLSFSYLFSIFSKKAPAKKKKRRKKGRKRREIALGEYKKRESRKFQHSAKTLMKRI